MSNFIYEYHLFGTFSWQSLVILGVGLVFMIIPMEDVNQCLFKLDAQNEVLPYEEVESNFDNVAKKHKIFNFFNKFIDFPGL